MFGFFIMPRKRLIGYIRGELSAQFSESKFPATCKQCYEHYFDCEVRDFDKNNVSCVRLLTG